ncbi:MAG TPA: PilZ domain-containing protein [Nitrospiraceae bacterium]|nr:PilZ domain-containing protein [Nitrospiraceae bacterium]
MLILIRAAAGVAEEDSATGALAPLSHLGPAGHMGEPMDLCNPTHFQVHVPMSFSGDRVAGEGTVYNLSTGGCKAESDTTVNTGAYLRLRLHLPDQDSSITIEVAAVRWAMGRDFGVEFISLPPD